MPNVFPPSRTTKSGGLLFVNEPGAASYRALRVDVGDQHLYWQPTYQNLLRVEGAFGEFFPQAEFFENGNRVLFTKHIEGVEVLGKTRALRPGERIPRREWVRFLATWKSFKQLADRSGIPEDFRNFIIKFGPPSVERYPAAYRIYRPHWYSRPRLFILWGLEPVGGADFISLSPEQAISEVGARVETDREEAKVRTLLWFKALACFLLACSLLLFFIWLCLPRPVVDFKLQDPLVNEEVRTTNLSGFDQDWIWGDTTYGWTFEKGFPEKSVEFEPKVSWPQPGLHDATLEVTQSTLWGLLYKSEKMTRGISVKPSPDKPTPNEPTPVKPTPVKPTPVEPTPVEPTPVKPTPVKPTPVEPTPVKPTPVEPTPVEPTPVEPTPVKPRPSPSEPRIIKPDEEPRNRVLNPPQLAVTKETVMNDGKSQELEFIATPSAGTVLEKVTIDGVDVAVSPDGRFRKQLDSGKHDIRVDYGSASQNVHESVNIPLTVDADKVVKPNNRLGAPIKLPSEGQGAPSAPDPAPAPQPQTSDKNDKKLA